MFPIASASFAVHIWHSEAGQLLQAALGGSTLDKGNLNLWLAATEWMSQGSDALLIHFLIISSYCSFPLLGDLRGSTTTTQDCQCRRLNMATFYHMLILDDIGVFVHVRLFYYIYNYIHMIYHDVLSSNIPSNVLDSHTLPHVTSWPMPRIPVPRSCGSPAGSLLESTTSSPRREAVLSPGSHYDI